MTGNPPARTQRRMGPTDSATSNALLDAAEHVLREEGYAAATSRRIAEVAGLKQQLVYYYFRTMDDLLLATFQRRAARALERLEQQLAQGNPLEMLWREDTLHGDPRLSFEFMALSSRHEGLRREVATFIAKARRMQGDAIARHFRDKGIDPGPASPAALVFLMSSAGLIMGKEAANGVTEGHADVRKLVDWAFSRLT